MASTAVMEHVLRKLHGAIQQNEVFRSDAQMSRACEILSSLKAQLEMTDLVVQTVAQSNWRRDVVHLACLVEHIVDEFIHAHEVGGPDYQKRFNELMERFSTLHQQMTELSNNQPRYDMDVSTLQPFGSAANGYDPRLPPTGTEAELLFGMDGASKKLALSLLVEAEKQLKGVSIVGFAGLGKTTLAMKIYHQIQRCFECKATALVSRRPDMKNLLQHILSQVHPEAPVRSETPEMQQLIDEIKEHLQNRRYLILLDDMWGSSSEIESAFPKNNCGSRIIMTTQIKRLAYLGLCGCDRTVYEMERLGVFDSAHLFSREIRCFRRNCPDCYETSRVYDGVPLATIAMACVMKQRIYSHNYMMAENAPEVQRATERILLSYFDLDPCLKAHMMLLCMFPLGFEIERKLILRIWKAEGFANSGSNGESTPEDILEQLIDRNVILPVKHSDISDMEVWKVYHLMFPTILRGAAEENFLITSSMVQLTRPTKVRRLALHSYNAQLGGEQGRHLDFGFISSLSIFSKANRVTLDKFTGLVVLNILGWEVLNNNDLKKICEMVLLRYLSIRNTRVSQIPETIRNLCHLQTLDLRNTRVTELPSEVGRLPKLSDLLVGSDEDPSFRVKVPTGFRYFGSLQTLGTIHLSDAWLLLDCLRAHLTEVAIMCPIQESSNSQDKLCRSLKQCILLESLTFYGGLGCSMEFLDDPPRGLREFRATGGFIKLPRWIADMENLVLLQIRVCQLQDDDVQALGELRKLQRLVLGLDFVPDQKIKITGFPSLERFSVNCRVPWLAFQPGAMPKLTELEIKFREGLLNQQDRVPSGIIHLLNLKRLALYYYYSSSWLRIEAIVKAMVKEVRDHVGPVKLVINGSADVRWVDADETEITEHANDEASTSNDPRPSTPPQLQRDPIFLRRSDVLVPCNHGSIIYMYLLFGLLLCILAIYLILN